MECNLLHNAYFGHDFVETGIAPAVARKGENPLVAGHRPMFEQDVVRHFEQPDIHSEPVLRRVVLIHNCLFTCWMFQRKVLYINIRQAREAAEQKCVPDKL